MVHESLLLLPADAGMGMGMGMDMAVVMRLWIMMISCMKYEVWSMNYEGQLES